MTAASALVLLPNSRALAASLAAPSPPRNVRVSHDGFHTHAEPSLAVNPRNPLNLLAACMVLSGSRRALASYASFDGGASWHSNGLLPETRFDYDADVTVTFDTAGRGYVCGWVGNHNYKGNLLVWRTTDGGRTFEQPVVGAHGFMDHPGIAAEQSDPATLYIAGRFYSGNKDGLAFCRSTDAGQSFSRPHYIDARHGPRGVLPVISAGLDTLAVMYYLPLATGGNLVRVITSTNRGQSFEHATNLTRLGPPPSSPVVQVRSGPAIAASPTRHALHAVVAPFDWNDSRSSLRLFTSLNQGRSWRQPITLATSRHAIYFQPQVAVDTHGRVAVSAFELTGRRVRVLLFISGTDQQFREPVVVTEHPFDPNRGSRGGGGASIGDYQALAATPDAFHPLWNDTRTGQLELFTAAVPT